ncbi:MAG: PAS domain S-box protein [Pirellulaceae bacterium]|jgi:PAS domain S-box-containing protein|nr:PAS domain S-box protein [Pirellulaceae bacterium]
MTDEPVAERRPGEQNLAELAIEAALFGMVMVNRDGVMVMVNSRTEMMFGYQRDELLGQQIEMLVPQRFRPGHPQLRQQYFQNPQPRPLGEGRYLFGVRSDGSEFPVELGLSPLETDEGLFVLAAVLDVTERKKEADEQARITHELKETQRASVNLMQDMERERTDAEKARAAAERAHAEAEQARTDLAQTVADLEQFNEMAVGREMRMIELKREVNTMAEAAGMSPPYDLDFEHADSQEPA